jgi:hypothetical protein
MNGTDLFFCAGTILAKGVVQPVCRDHQHAAKKGHTYLCGMAWQSCALKSREEDASQASRHQADHAPASMQPKAANERNSPPEQ